MSHVMARPSEVPGKPATERIDVRVNPSMLAFVDGAKGKLSRAAYVRSLIRADAAKKTKERK